MCDAILGRRDINMNQKQSLPFCVTAGGGGEEREQGGREGTIENLEWDRAVRR